MKNLSLILALLWAMPALAQGYHYQNIALGPLGHPVSTATITVCAAAATGAPCSPTTPIFSDAGLSVPKQNPFTSDGLGNFDFYVAPGSYVFTITGEEVSAGQSYAITVPCVPNTLAAGCGGAGSGGPNGVNDSIQTDLNGQLHGDNNFLWNPTTQILSVLGSVGINQTAPQFNLDVTGSAAFNQFESAYVVADRMAGADMCAKIANAWVAVKSINANGGIVDARGFKGSQHCAASMWTNYPASQFNGTLLTDNVNIQTDVSQMMPVGTHWSGFSGHATTTPFTNTGTSIQPSAAFPSSTPIVAMGANAGDSGIQIEGLRISCITPAGTNVAGGIGLQNQKAQEDSWARNIIIDGCADTGLDWTTSQAQNSGSLENITVAEDGVSVVTATCARFGSASTSTLQLSRGVHGITCNGGSASVEPNVGIDIEAQNLDITGVHLEEYVTGIEIGASKSVQGLLLGNVNCSSNMSFPMGKCIDISAASGTTSTAIFAVDTGGINITDVLKDNMTSGCEISEAAEGTDLGSYIHGHQNIILTSAKTCPQNILNANVAGVMAPATGGTIDANILNGVTLSGTPSAGDQCIASSSTTAAIWQPCPGGGGNVSTSSSMTNLNIPLATGAASIGNSQITEQVGVADTFAKSLRVTGPSPWFDVEAAGAVCDGSTDDTAAIQNAMNAAGNGTTGGGVVYIPPSVNGCIASQIVLKSGVSLEGANSNESPNGDGSMLVQKSGGNEDFIVSDTSLTATQFQQWTHISNLAIIGNVANTVGSGIKFNSRVGTLTTFDHLFLKNFAADCIDIAHGSTPIFVTDVHAFDCGDATGAGYGLEITRTGSDTTQIALINGLEGDDNKNATLHISGGAGMQAVQAEAWIVNGVKCQKSRTGHENDCIVIDGMNGTPVSINGASLDNTSGEVADATIKVASSTVKLNWTAVNTDLAANVPFTVNDANLGITSTSEAGYDAGAKLITAPLTTGTGIINSDCVKWILTGGVITLGDAGAACGSASGAVTSVFGLTGAVLPANTTAIPETPVSVSSATTLAPGGVPVDNVTGTTYTVLCADDVRHKLFSSATAVAVTLFPANSCASPAQPSFTMVVSVGGAGSVTITPTTSTIGKVGGTQAASLLLTTGQYAFLYTDTVSSGCTTNGCYDALVGP